MPHLSDGWRGEDSPVAFFDRLPGCTKKPLRATDPNRAVSLSLRDVRGKGRARVFGLLKQPIAPKDKRQFVRAPIQFATASVLDPPRPGLGCSIVATFARRARIAFLFRLGGIGASPVMPKAKFESH